MTQNMNVEDSRQALMMKKRTILIGAAIVTLTIVWLLFRPELLFVNRTVNESLPGVSGMKSSGNMEPKTLASGSFHSVAHETKGRATIHQLGAGKRVLRLTGFETSNGPDVRVYLVAAADANDNDTVKNAGFIELGKLKGNIGDQNYDIPDEVDLNKYQAVTVWCARFGVNFGTAPMGRTDTK